jgi:hypothetical protein
MTFVECDTCRAKPGTPQLCRGCLINRATIEAAMTRQQRVADRLSSVLSESNRVNAQIAAWRQNYRELILTQNEENNRLRELASCQAQTIEDLVQRATRKRWWQLWR